MNVKASTKRSAQSSPALTSMKEVGGAAPLGQAEEKSLADKAKKAHPWAVAQSMIRPFVDLVFSDRVTLDRVPSENREKAKNRFLRFVLVVELVVAAALSIFLMLIFPIFKEPIYQYYGMRDGGGVPIEMVALPTSNQTNSTIISWAEKSVTSLMTLGFGDYEEKLIAQQSKFTKEGWQVFVRDFLDNNVGEQFKLNQLVLTTVPIGAPTIVEQGPHLEHLYQWKVTVPVVMTFATNNNTTIQKRETVNLTIVRSFDVPEGIAIQAWRM